ncbi:hypothetical protein LguiB_032693 [Lonicera macranthoides]
MGQWSELLGELLETIEENLVLYGDKVRVRAVCAAWNSRLEKMPNHKERRLPWLLHPLTKDSQEASHGLFSFAEKKVYYLDLPDAQEKLFKGSSYGWVVTIDDVPTSCNMYLINPLTRSRIQLPPRSAFPDVVDYCADKVDEEYALVSESLCTRNCVVDGIKDGIKFYYTNHDHLINLMNKVILSSPPSCNDCVVVAVYGELKRVAYCKRNDKQWTHLNINAVLDVIFYKGKLYALKNGGLIVFDNITSTPRPNEIVVKAPLNSIFSPAYLVESSDGDLLMVSRRVYTYDGHLSSIVRTHQFGVYKLDLSNWSWIEVKNIEDDIIFLGCNSSMAFSSRDFPGFKGNCIYFTDGPLSFGGKEFKQEDSDIGVFNLEDKSVNPLPDFKCKPRFLWPLPIWII